MAASRVTVRGRLLRAGIRAAVEVRGADVTEVRRRVAGGRGAGSDPGDAGGRRQVVGSGGGHDRDVGIRHDLVVALVRRAHRRRRRPVLRIPHW